MASLQARHSAGCRLDKEWSSFDAAGESCTCKARYYVVVRKGKKNEKTPVGTNRKEAKKALAKISVALDENTYRPQKNMKFEEWADQWLDSLRGIKETTKDSYRPTLAYAKEAFGWKVVRRLDLSDVVNFLNAMEGRVGESTRAKHLRVLSECLTDAMTHGYAGRNPAKELPKSQRPRATTTEAAYFEDEELPAVFAQVPFGSYRVLFELALKTGMRQGELLAVRWGDVDLGNALITVRFNRTGGRTTDTKNRQRRTVDFTTDVVELLGRWWGESGNPPDDALVFPGYFGESGYLSASRVVKVLYKAMEAAGIPRVGPTGEKRTFHSFRHTFVRIALENHRPLAWVSRHIGHSGVQITDNVYGHFASEARKAEVQKLEGAFVV